MDNHTQRLEIIEILKSTSHFFNETRAALCEPYGLSAIQAIIVLDVYHNPTETKVTDICRRLNKSTNSISPLIHRLVEKGYFEKRQSQKDSRVFEVFLTEKTKEVTKKIHRDVSDFAWPMFDQLTTEEFEQLYESLQILKKVCVLK